MDESAPHSSVDPGQSISRRGEDVLDEEGSDPDREHLGPQGTAQRPVGTSTARDSTGVGPQEPKDDDSPTLGTGSQ